MHWVDPACLPAVSGTLERFIMNPHGELDGLVLIDDAREAKLVHFPPHMASEVAATIRPGDALSVHGIRPRGADLIAAVALIAADGREIVDQGRGAHDQAKKEGKQKRKPGMQASGTVRLALYAPKGELRGALLEDGTVLRVGPKEAEGFADLLRPGATLGVRGEGLETEHGVVIDAREIGPALNELRSAKKPKPHEHGEKHKEHHHHGDHEYREERLEPAVDEAD